MKYIYDHTTLLFFTLGKCDAMWQNLEGEIRSHMPELGRWLAIRRLHQKWEATHILSLMGKKSTLSC